MKIDRYRDPKKGGWKWRVDVTVAGRRIREADFVSKGAVKEFVLELKALAKKGKFGLEVELGRVLLDDLIRERLIDTSKHASARQTKRILESFGARYPGVFIDQIKAAEVQEWAREFIRGGVDPETVNRYKAIVSAMFSAAPLIFPHLGEEWRGPKIKWEKEKRGGRDRVISSEEISRLLQALRLPGTRTDGRRYRAQIVASRREVADCLELALLTGMRGKEVRCLEWSEVDLKSSEVMLPAHKTKTNEARVVLLSSRAVEILTRRSGLRSQIKTRFVFPNPTGEKPRTEISNVVRPVARRLGLRYGRNLEDGFSPHDTRHTAATNMLRAGHDLKTVQDVLGHTDRTMSLRYSHSTRKSRRAAVEDLVKQSG